MLVSPISKSTHPFYAASSFSKNISTLLSGSPKWERNILFVDYHPSPSKLTSRIHPLVFLWTSKRFISPEYFLKFSSNLYIYPTNNGCGKQAPQGRRGAGDMGPTLFEIVLRQGLLEQTLMRRKIEFFHFCSFPKAKLSHRQKEITHFTQTAFSENLFFPNHKGRRIMELKKLPKLNLWEY